MIYGPVLDGMVLGTLSYSTTDRLCTMQESVTLNELEQDTVHYLLVNQRLLTAMISDQ